MAKRHPSKTLASSSITAAPAPFDRLFYEYTAAEDLAQLSKNDCATIAASVWELMQQRPRGTINLRVFNPSRDQHGYTVDHTIMELAMDDMPFLVDSVTGELHRRGIAIHLAVHPVVFVARNKNGQLEKLLTNKEELTAERAEAVMHIQFDRTTDGALLKDLQQTLRAILQEVSMAVADWQPMRATNAKISMELRGLNPIVTAKDDLEEARSFLGWLDDNNFTYLGYRRLNLTSQNGKPIWKVEKSSGLGILRDDAVRLFGGLREFGMQHPEIRAYLEKRRVVIVTKTNIAARVHRTVPMDAIFVQRLDDRDNIIGEDLFVGLFTSASYAQSPRDVPFIRHKIQQILDRAGLDPVGHDGKALVHILDTYPRDELFQINIEELFQHTMGILQLRERARVGLFVRQDPFKRFVTCLIYVPRDRYDSELRQKIQQHLLQAFQGSGAQFQTRIDDSPLARVFLTINTTDKAKAPDVKKLEQELKQLSRSWSDLLHEALVKWYGESKALEFFKRYNSAFPAVYRENIKPDAAIFDLANLEDLRTHNRFIADIFEEAGSSNLHLKLYSPQQPLILSEILPIIENMGLRINYMSGPYELMLDPTTQQKIYLHEFVGTAALPLTQPFATVKPVFEQAFAQVVAGKVENDSFNMLTLRAGLTAREIVILRSAAKYLRQLRIPYSQDNMAQVLAQYAPISLELVRLFKSRHDPALAATRTQQSKQQLGKIQDLLQAVTGLEDDRILRRYLNFIQSTLRTNYFLNKDYLSIKLDSRALDYMPLPKPLVEIFVYSTRIEAVHLRGGKVARGGIRWSDRKEDFRNEILGLMKAQMVKNSVIVPVGSKGGFILKQPPQDSAAFQAEGIACYRMMMTGLLDITDNLKNGKVIPPANIVRHDGDDPYLVVAADKGTAKFSDIANGIAQDYGFWLDDAFASGGSAGYDHKEMGITARGAWEAIKRHFREIGTDIQTTDFTVAGVGDMSGDVFGNAMLLSKHIRLIGAFDHRHIFCDPTPDAAQSWQERQRLFHKPTSSWADYDSKKLSKGGAIFARNEKSLKLTPEIRKAFGISSETVSPSELITAILKTPVDLLYFGGIGTYVKASDESHEEAGDRSNDAQRIDGREIHAKVIGEGANLGLTQRGRIEYAQQGGRINTDAIDNSAGVDTSDHEVNIKILLRQMLASGDLTLAARNKILASMTDDVATLVLRDNYLQAQALSLAQARAVELLPSHTRTIRALEKANLLDRRIEFMPDDAELQDRQRNKAGLTRPELAILLSYSKIWLYDQLLSSDLPDDSFLQEDLARYFPHQLSKKYPDAIRRHQLGREIIATHVTNSLINRGGSHFVTMMQERTGQSPVAIARAYLMVREIFQLRNLWEAIETLDSKVSAQVQLTMLLTISDLLNSGVAWLLQHHAKKFTLGDTIRNMQNAVSQFTLWLEKRPDSGDRRSSHFAQKLIEQKVPQKLARQISQLTQLSNALDIIHLAADTRHSIDKIADIFFTLGTELGLDWLFDRSQIMLTETPWQREALITLLDDLSDTQQMLTAQIAKRMAKTQGQRNPQQILLEWKSTNHDKLTRYKALLDEIQSTGSLDIAMLTLASRQLASLIN